VATASAECLSDSRGYAIGFYPAVVVVRAYDRTAKT
jgi:hypothetical protein